MAFVPSPSPSLPPSGVRPTKDSFRALRKKSPAPAKMMKIQSLLNPTPSGGRRYSDTTNSTCFPSPSVYSGVRSSNQPSPELATPNTVSSVGYRKKNIDKSPFPGTTTTQAVVKYAPHELHDTAFGFSKNEVEELHRQHKLFKVKPSPIDGSGLIGNSTRYIPYASEKKTFFDKTRRDGFNVFHYTFLVPGEPDAKEQTVMWDYENGLVRITPFFKACRYTKTTPAKALTSTPGLKDLAHSITGGALAAQGYWLPYECARAVCLTFAHKIRWPLVHIFGPSFVRECRPSSHNDFGKFAIPREIVRCAELVAKGWKAGPTKDGDGIPRSAPAEERVVEKKELRPRAARPVFKSGSPFDSEWEGESEGYHRAATPGTETLSPKSSPDSCGGWTSINPPNTPTSNFSAPPTPPLKNSLLTQPRFATWRPADASSPHHHPPIKMPTSAHDNHRTHKRPRRRSSPSPPINSPSNPTADESSDLLSYADISSDSDSESDDIDIPLPRKKRARYHSHNARDEDAGVSSSATKSPDESMRQTKRTRMQGGNKMQPLKSVKYTAEDKKAAALLLELHLHDQALATGPDGIVRTPRGLE